MHREYKFSLLCHTHAEETLTDRRHFGLNAEQWEAFMAALDAPPRELPRVKRLFSEPSIFENDASV